MHYSIFCNFHLARLTFIFSYTICSKNMKKVQRQQQQHPKKLQVFYCYKLWLAENANMLYGMSFFVTLTCNSIPGVSTYSLYECQVISIQVQGLTGFPFLYTCSCTTFTLHCAFQYIVLFLILCYTLHDVYSALCFSYLLPYMEYEMGLIGLNGFSLLLDLFDEIWKGFD